jgi:hypothetical protein
VMRRVYKALMVAVAICSLCSAVATTAQAAPHWYKNGTRVAFRNSPEVPVIAWGDVTIATVTIGTIVCPVTGAGNIWNPPSESAGLDEFVALETYSCSISPATACEAGLTFAASGLPWEGGLFVDSKSVIRDRIKGMKFTLACTKPVASWPFEGELTPKFVNGTSVERPSYIEFDSESGHLTNGSLGELKMGGRIKFAGFEETELITAKNP